MSELLPNSAASRTVLTQLAAGATIAQACQTADCGLAEFQAWWQEETRRRVPGTSGNQPAAVRQGVEMVRDRWGIAHVFAANEYDLFFGNGYALAQDRLWQLDFLRRRALGTLAEVLGPEAVFYDRTVRTLGIPQLAEQEWEQLDDETRPALTAFADGVNALLESLTPDAWPVEFALLDYEPRPWLPRHSLALMAEFRWYLTGRFPVICIPELARRVLGDGELFDAFITPEAAEDTILPPGSYPTEPAAMQRYTPGMGKGSLGGGSSLRGGSFEGGVGGDPSPGQGSNNWVVAPSRSATGAPLLASDPHIAYGALSCWHEIHLCGAGYNVAGMNYVGLPGVMFGRNEHVAWGITNNICSQRDLYQEQTSAEHPGCFRYADAWEPATPREETIAVRDGEAITFTVAASRNGPIVSDILPPPMNGDEAVSVKWLGADAGRELASLLAYNRAGSAAQFRRALEPWLAPTFSVVYADRAGHIGYQAVGRIPVRTAWRRGYRRGWDPADAWQALVPFDGMPHLEDLPRGWIATANHRNAPPDYPYPLSGCWGPGHRGRRINQLLEPQRPVALGDCRKFQHDEVSLRAAEGTPGLLRLLGEVPPAGLLHDACEYLRGWDYQMEAGSVATAVFEVFFQHWTRAVAAARFGPHQVELAAGGNWGLSLRLLQGDDLQWFAAGDLAGQVRGAMDAALAELQQRLGPDVAGWQWGRLHRLTMRHPLSQRGELGSLLDRGDLAVGGGLVTLCNMAYDAEYRVVAGANYRMLVDLTEQGMWAASASGESGCPGSLHYCDQTEAWHAGHEHFLSLNADEVRAAATAALSLRPR